jgi:hypothetical protein
MREIKTNSGGEGGGGLNLYDLTPKDRGRASTNVDNFCRYFLGL